MDDVITIRYRHGTFTINMPAFFPASQKDIRLLFSKIVWEIAWYEDQKKAVEKILSWLRGHQDAKEQLRNLADEYASLERRLSDHEKVVAEQEEEADRLARSCEALPAKERRMFKEEHVLPAKERVKEMKECSAWIVKQMKGAEKASRALEKNAKKMEENISLIESLAAGRKL